MRSSTFITASVRPRLRLEAGDRDRPVLEGRPGRPLVGQGVLQPLGVVAFREVLARMCAATFSPVQGSGGHDFREIQEIAQLLGLKQFGVEGGAADSDRDGAKAALQLADLRPGRGPGGGAAVYAHGFIYTLRPL